MAEGGRRVKESDPSCRDAAAPRPGSVERVMVVLTDPLSGIIDKGAVVARYYNPGSLFREVHFLLLNDDRPDPSSLKYMVGDAEVFVHNVPLPSRLFFRSLGWQPFLMGDLVRRVTRLAATLQPRLIRAYCAGLNSLIANRAGRALGIPVLVSVHSRPDFWVAGSIKQHAREFVIARLADRVVREADNVLAIYQPQLPYFRRMGVEPVLIRNVIAGDTLRHKTSYSRAGSLKLMCVGRHMPGKDISSIIAAAAALSEVELTIVGDGPLHEGLVALASRLGVASRCRFVKVWPNADLCAHLHEYDVFAANTIWPETPKAVMEPMLAGLPCVMNRNLGDYESELEGAALLVEDCIEGYRAALQELLADEARRRSVGLACRARALSLWEPAATEAAHAALHAKLAR